MKKEKITIDDIAKELGCSKSTVSRALSGKGRIGDEMRKKVLSCCEKNGYKPNVIAASLAKSKTYNLGVVIPADELGPENFNSARALYALITRLEDE